jgi:hypothetical protein
MPDQEKINSLISLLERLDNGLFPISPGSINLRELLIKKLIPLIESADFISMANNVYLKPQLSSLCLTKITAECELKKAESNYNYAYEEMMKTNSELVKWTSLCEERKVLVNQLEAELKALYI